MELTTEVAAVRIAVALLLGAVIGIERQWNRHASGLRTSALVSTGAALFVLLSLGFPGQEASATRVAAQVVSGVGFLGAGVILRDGINVRGLTTAATLWSAAAVGTLAAAGMFAVAAIGAAAVIFANVVLQPVKRALDRRSPVVVGPLVRYELRATCRATHEAHVRGLLVGGLTDAGHRLRAVNVHPAAEGTVDLLVELVEGDADERGIEQLVRRVGVEPEVLTLRWDARSAPDGSVDLTGWLRRLRRR